MWTPVFADDFLLYYVPKRNNCRGKCAPLYHEFVAAEYPKPVKFEPSVRLASLGLPQGIVKDNHFVA